MSKETVNIVRAWKDAEYRASLSQEELASIPANPAGEALSDVEKASVNAGGSGLIFTVSGECQGGICCNLFTSLIRY